MIHLREQYFALQVADANNAVISGNTITWKTENAQARGFIPLPPGTWEVVCTSKEATEDQLKDIIPEMKVGQRYQNYNGDYPVWYHSRRESFRSLLTSKGCDVNRNWLILKKQ
jgi:hypothetical protein